MVNREIRAKLSVLALRVHGDPASVRLIREVSSYVAELEKSKRRWSAEELEFAQKNYGPMTARQIGKKIGRSPHAVRAHLGRSKNESN